MKKYANNYKAGEQGYEYIGNWYLCQLPEQKIKQILQFNLVIILVLSILYVLSMSENTAGSHVFFILLPGISIFLPVVYFWMGQWNLYSWLKKQQEIQKNGKNAGRLRQSEYDRAIRRPLHCSVAILALAGIASTASLIYTVAERTNLSVLQEAVFIGEELLILIGGMFLFYNSRRIYTETVITKETKAE